MEKLKVTVGDFEFIAKLEKEKAPKTCEVFCTLLPLDSKIIQVSWSGEADWVPMGNDKFDVPYENFTSDPAPGEILFFPGDITEGELLIAWGATRFAAKTGQLVGNHFLTIIEGAEQLPAMGKKVLWDGAQRILIEEYKG